MLQAKECAFLTQELSAISHSKAVALIDPRTLWFLAPRTGNPIKATLTIVKSTHQGSNTTVFWCQCNSGGLSCGQLTQTDSIVFMAPNANDIARVEQF